MTPASQSAKLVTAFAVYVPLLALCVAWNLLAGGFGDPAWPLVVAGGLLAWTLIEYLLHRFVFHYPFRSRRMRATQLDLHLAHHERPERLELIVAGLSFSLPIGLAIFALLRLGLGTWERASLAMAGVIVGYLCYESIHFGIHTGAKGGALLRFWRRQHLSHHFADASRAFGVTSPLWDAVFGTRRR